MRAFSLAAVALVACTLPHPADVAPPDTLIELRTSRGVLDPPFAPEVGEYDLDLVLAEPDTSFTPIATIPGGTTIAIDGATIDSGAASPALALAIGETRDVHLVLTRAGGDVRSYTIHVHRGVDGLASLTPSRAALDPAFDASITSYTLGLHLADASAAFTPALLFPDRASLTVAGAPLDSGATTAALPFAPGPDAVPVIVTPHTRPARAYDVEVVRGIDALGSIRLAYAGGPITNAFDPVFDSATTSYTVDVGLWLQTASIAATPFIAGTTVTVAGDPVPAGAESTPVPLNVGTTILPVVVTASDGSKTTYTVKIVRAGPVAQRAYVKASNHTFRFGDGISLWGDTMVVGASGDASAAVGVDGDQSDTSAAGAGAAYVLVRSAGQWSQQAYLKASNTNTNDQFGSAVAVSGDTIAVGAPLESSAATGIDGNQSDNSLQYAGAVYVFRRSASTWAQEAYVKPSQAHDHGRFGRSVALWNDVLAVAGDSSLYVFRRTGAIWAQEAMLRADPSRPGDALGGPVAIWGDTIVVGASSLDANNMNVGAAYVFRFDGGTWTQQGYLKASNPGPDQFGTAVAISGDTVVVGAQEEASASRQVDAGEDDNSAPLAGAAYVFVRSGSTWSQQAFLKAPNTDAGDSFGRSVAVFGERIVVGAIDEASSATGLNGDESINVPGAQSGAAYVFRRFYDNALHRQTWEALDYLKASNTGPDDWFGRGVALWGDTCAVASPLETSAATGIDGDQTNTGTNAVGAVYVFQ